MICRGGYKVGVPSWEVLSGFRHKRGFCPGFGFSGRAWAWPVRSCGPGLFIPVLSGAGKEGRFVNRPCGRQGVAAIVRWHFCPVCFRRGKMFSP